MKTTTMNINGKLYAIKTTLRRTGFWAKSGELYEGGFRSEESALSAIARRIKNQSK